MFNPIWPQKKRVLSNNFWIFEKKLIIIVWFAFFKPSYVNINILPGPSVRKVPIIFATYHPSVSVVLSIDIQIFLWNTWFLSYSLSLSNNHWYVFLSVDTEGIYLCIFQGTNKDNDLVFLMEYLLLRMFHKNPLKNQIFVLEQ